MTTLALDRLVTDVRPVVAQAVDVLHVAAILESRGVTDELAREHYGAQDVFDLAALVRGRVAGGRSATARGRVRLPHPGAVELPVRRHSTAAGLSRGGSSVGHGAIYLLPALSMPALLALVGTRYVVLALIVGGALGWVWAVVSTWCAYFVWGQAGREAAARLQGRLTLAGVTVGIGTAAVMVRGGLVPPRVGVVIAAVVTAQLGTTLLFFLRRRAVLTAIFLVPAAVGGVWLARPGTVGAPVVLAVFLAAGATAVLVGCAGLLSRPPASDDQRRKPVPGAQAAWVTGYAVAAATFLLLPQALLLARQPVALVALAGLFLAMGVVEWRGARLSDRLRQLLAREHRVGRFRRRTATQALGEALLCAVACAATSGLVLAAMARFDVLTRAAVGLAVVAVPLAAVYLLAMVLANTGAYAWLATFFALGAALEVAGPVLYGTTVVGAFGAAACTVLVALLAGVITRPLHLYR